MPLTGFDAHWWIIKKVGDNEEDDEPLMDGEVDETPARRGRGRSSSGKSFTTSYVTNGHIGYLYQNELYELKQGRSGFSKLHKCGVIFGADQVVIYFEPTSDNVTTNTSRSQILIGSEPPDLDELAEEFRINMPRVLKEFIESRAAKSTCTMDATVKERILEVANLFTRGGCIRVKDKSTATVSSDRPDKKDRGSRSPDPEPRNPPVNHGTHPQSKIRAIKPGGDLDARPVDESDFPQIIWKFADTEGANIEGEFGGKAATYVANSNQLLVNGEFIVFNRWIEFFVVQYPNQAGVREAIKSRVRNIWELTLLDVVLNYRELMRIDPDWQPRDAPSDEYLTLAVTARYHLIKSLRAEISSLLGPPTEKEPSLVDTLGVVENPRTVQPEAE